MILPLHPNERSGWLHPADLERATVADSSASSRPAIDLAEYRRGARV